MTSFVLCILISCQINLFHSSIIRRKHVVSQNHHSGLMVDGDDMDTDSMEDDDDTKYSEKSQETALLLSILLGGYGGGRFYVGDYGLASAKLILAIFGFYLWMLFHVS